MSNVLQAKILNKRFRGRHLFIIIHSTSWTMAQWLAELNCPRGGQLVRLPAIDAANKK